MLEFEKPVSIRIESASLIFKSCFGSYHFMLESTEFNKLKLAGKENKYRIFKKKIVHDFNPILLRGGVRHHP